MNFLTVGVLVMLQIVCMFTAPYVRESYISHDCYGFFCPKNTVKCVKSSVITESRDAMKSLISCIGRGGSVLLTKNILEPVESKNGPIRIHSVITAIEMGPFVSHKQIKPSTI